MTLPFSDFLYIYLMPKLISFSFKVSVLASRRRITLFQSLVSVSTSCLITSAITDKNSLHFVFLCSSVTEPGPIFTSCFTLAGFLKCISKSDIEYAASG